MSHRLKVAIGVVISALGVWLSMRDVRPAEVWQSLRQANYFGFVAAALLTLLAFLAPMLATSQEIIINEVLAGNTTIAAQWNDVMDLTVRLGAHNAAISAAERPNGVSGWMYLGGEANTLGNARYNKLVAIINSKPANAEDLGIIARAAMHRDILDGPKSYAASRLADAAIALQAA